MTNVSPTYFYVYVLISDKDGKYYVGFTQNLSLRFEQHQKERLRQQNIEDLLGWFILRDVFVRKMLLKERSI